MSSKGQSYLVMISVKDSVVELHENITNNKEISPIIKNYKENNLLSILFDI